MHITSFGNVISIEHTASTVFAAFWLALPLRERTNFIRFSEKHIIVLHLQIFNTNFFFFHNLGFILKIFLKFREFQPRYSY